MEFKKGQELEWTSQAVRVRVHSGPHRGVGDHPLYLVERLTGPYPGSHVLLKGMMLAPLAPKVGDTGRLGGYLHRWRIHHIDNVAVLLERVDEFRAYEGFSREYFDKYWRAES